MSPTRSLTHEALAGLVDSLVEAGVRIIAPARAPDGGLDYGPIRRLDEADLGTVDMPRRSLRSVFQPPTEILFSWLRQQGGVQLTPSPVEDNPCVILGARPCDASGAQTLDAVMGWDYRDEFWFARRDATTIITLACGQIRPACFCEDLGFGPSNTTGSDLMLHAAGGGYLVEVITTKGEAFVTSYASWFTASDETTPPVQGKASPLPMEGIREWIESHFDDPYWSQLALRCLGCGACTSICPTCHCFDIVDETDGTQAGARRRNWDTCQAGLFTLHASGHNPRPDQTSRCRQRVMHKFAIYPAKFGQVLCTGCGRCVEACPAGVLLPEILAEIAQRVAGAPVGENA